MQGERPTGQQVAMSLQNMIDVMLYLQEFTPSGFTITTGISGTWYDKIHTGAPKDKVMVLYIASVVSFVVGVFLFVKK